MPEINSPKVTMADEDLRGRNDRGLPSRKWSCPEDDVLAVYTDGALRGIGKRWVEFHLSGCARCRSIVAEAVKAQRELDLPSPPAELRWEAIGFAAPRPARKRWVWLPVGALAVVALLVAGSVVLHKPESLIIQSPPSPSAPIIAKSEPLAVPRTDVVRKPTSTEPLLSIVSPRQKSVVSRDQLKFVWKSIAKASYYEVRVVTSDGDLVWQGQTEKTDLQAPRDVVVRDGSYFVWVTAYLTDGRLAKSAPLKFVLNQ
jgi:hypothetical protein